MGGIFVRFDKMGNLSFVAACGVESSLRSQKTVAGRSSSLASGGLFAHCLSIAYPFDGSMRNATYEVAIRQLNGCRGRF